MAGKKKYSVIVPLVIARTESGDLYLYHGAVVPDEISDDEVKRLLEGEFIAVGDAPADPSEDEKAAADKAAADKKAADEKAAADKAAADAAKK